MGGLIVSKCQFVLEASTESSHPFPSLSAPASGPGMSNSHLVHDPAGDSYRLPSLSEQNTCQQLLPQAEAPGSGWTGSGLQIQSPSILPSPESALL